MSFTYDANGNLTADGTSSYTYDVKNRLVTSSAGAQFVYDPKGRLFELSSGGQVTRFVHDGDQMALEYNSAGAVTRRFMFAGVDEPVLEATSTALSRSRIGDRQLLPNIARHQRRRRGGRFKEGTDAAQRLELDGHAEPVVFAAVLANEGQVGVIEVEVPGQQVRCRFAGEAGIATDLLVGEETDRHGRRRLGCRNLGRRTIAASLTLAGQQLTRRLARLPFGIDIGVECQDRDAVLTGDIAGGIVPIGHHGHRHL